MVTNPQDAVAIAGHELGGDEQRTAVSRLLATRQEVATLRDRLDREHRVLEAILGSTVAPLVRDEELFELTAEQVVGTFDCEAAFVVRLDEVPTLYATCGGRRPEAPELVALAARVEVMVAEARHVARDAELEGLTLAGRAIGRLLAAVVERSDHLERVAVVAVVSREKLPFYDGFVGSLAPAFAMFARYLATVWQNVRARALIEHQLVELRDSRNEVAAMNQRLTQVVESLEQAVAERTKELATKNEALVRSTQIKSEFLATMSHELRTPLTSVIGFAESLLFGTYGPVTERQRSVLSTMQESGAHLLALIGDVLDMSQLEAGKLTLEPEPVPISELCSSCLDLIHESASRKRIRVGYSCDDGSLMLTADPRRIRQVLLNLLGNAVKFTDPGGTIGLSVTSSDTEVRLAVWDTGIGIKPESLSKLFVPFVQVDTNHTRRFEGSGLGLALSDYLVRMHGGTIEVQSEFGRGSRFEVVLRRDHTTRTGHPATAQFAREARKPEGAPRGPLVMVVDDHEATLRFISDALTAASYRIVVAEDGRAAVQLGRRLRPAAILLDIHMPGTDGLTATAELRRMSETQVTPIIAMSASASREDRQRAFDAGATEFLEKPVRLAKLLERLDAVLAPQGELPA